MTARRNKTIIICLCLFTICVVILTALYYVYDRFTVTDIAVTGNRHYTNDEITEIVTDGWLGHNSLYLSMKYKNKPIENIPFVETMDVDIVSPTSISITVYEKAIAGCVEYLDRYMYFDKDGMVVESSTIRQLDIPYVTGLRFDHVVLYETLPIGDNAVFKEILNITQLLSKYSIVTDQIYFDTDKNVTLYFGQSRVLLGSMDNIDEKMLRLQGIIPELGELKGVLYMDNYTEDADVDYITFQRDADVLE